MNHKRGRAKNRRAGCISCKPWKANGASGKEQSQTWQERKARVSEREQIAEHFRTDFMPYWGEDDWDDSCDCSDCCFWEDNLVSSSAYLPEPLVQQLDQSGLSSVSPRR